MGSQEPALASRLKNTRFKARHTNLILSKAQHVDAVLSESVCGEEAIVVLDKEGNHFSYTQCLSWRRQNAAWGGRSPCATGPTIAGAVTGASRSKVRHASSVRLVCTTTQTWGKLITRSPKAVVSSDYRIHTNYHDSAAVRIATSSFTPPLSVSKIKLYFQERKNLKKKA
jgi:hypothetical protein